MDEVLDADRFRDIGEILELRRNGYSYREIANRLGISKTKAWEYGRNVGMKNDRRYQRQRTEGVGAFRKNEEDGRKIGTWRDIPYYNGVKNTPERQKADVVEKERLRRLRERRAEEAGRERSKRWRDNEKLHEAGRMEQIGVGTELGRFVGSMMSRKNPGGHVAKGFEHGMKMFGIKRELLERGGDVRLIGDNMRKLAGDENSLLGFGFVHITKDGILGHFRKRFLESRNEKTRTR